MQLITAFKMISLLVCSTSAHWIPKAHSNERATCDESQLNATIGSYTVTMDDTIFSIAASVSRGVCDIARYNRLPVAQEIYVGLTLAIPPQVCEPDNDTCLLVDMDPTMDCIFGGPHVYTSVGNESTAYIARYKFGITAESLFNGTSRMLPANATVDTILPEGQALKLPQCSPSQCEIQPYALSQEVYKDIATKFGSTVGQIMGFNPSYNHSPPGGDHGPVITVPMNCKLLSNNYTIIS